MTTAIPGLILTDEEEETITMTGFLEDFSIPKSHLVSLLIFLYFTSMHDIFRSYLVKTWTENRSIITPPAKLCVNITQKKRFFFTNWLLVIVYIWLLSFYSWLPFDLIETSGKWPSGVVLQSHVNALFKTGHAKIWRILVYQDT